MSKEKKVLVKNIGQRSFQCGPRDPKGPGSHSVILAPGQVMQLPELVAGKLLKLFASEVVAVDAKAAEAAKAASKAAHEAEEKAEADKKAKEESEAAAKAAAAEAEAKANKK